MDKLAELNHGAKVVLGSAIAFLIFSFFDWQQVEFAGVSAGRSMWAGVGWIAGLLAIALIVWQAIRLANFNLEIGVGPAMVTTFLAVLLFVFTLIKFLADGEARNWPAWIGLILAIVIVAGAWMNMKMTGESLGDLQKLGGGAGGGGSGGGSSTPSSTPTDTTSTPSAGDDSPGS